MDLTSYAETKIVPGKSGCDLRALRSRRLAEELETAVGTRVDVVFKNRLRPYIAERMTRDKLRLL